MLINILYKLFGIVKHEYYLVKPNNKEMLKLKFNIIEDVIVIDGNNLHITLRILEKLNNNLYRTWIYTEDRNE